MRSIRLEFKGSNPMADMAQIFWEAHRPGGLKVPDPEKVDASLEAARRWRDAGRFFNAYYASDKAIEFAFGDKHRFRQCVDIAVASFEDCLQSSSEASLEAICALQKWRHFLGYLDIDETERRAIATDLSEEAAERLVRHYTGSQRETNFLVLGFRMQGDLVAPWRPLFLPYEVWAGIETWGQGGATINVDSAFYRFIGARDYVGAAQIMKLCPQGFVGPGLEGWCAAVKGLLGLDESARWFHEAADHFASDRPPTESDRGSRDTSWSGVNSQLWTHYFSSRAALAEIASRPEDTQRLLTQAASAITKACSVWADVDVGRYKILLGVLCSLCEHDATTLDLQKVRGDLARQRAVTGTAEYDPLIESFLSNVSNALTGMREDPTYEITKDHLPKALGALERIPTIGERVTEAMRPAIGDARIASLHRPVKTRVYKVLEELNDEKTLQQVLLRLIRADFPLYADIRHGPIEYGKDIVSVVETDGQTELRMYQVKCGDITKANWDKCRSELEEMFVVPLSKLQVTESPSARVGILVCNGHANAYVEPVMVGWIEAQRKAHGWNIQFMNIDDIVTWIMSAGLLNEFRASLDELKIATVN